MLKTAVVRELSFVIALIFWGFFFDTFDEICVYEGDL